MGATLVDVASILELCDLPPSKLTMASSFLCWVGPGGGGGGFEPSRALVAFAAADRVI